ncbi:MAG: glutamate racemase [Thalassotalea sp.]
MPLPTAPNDNMQLAPIGVFDSGIGGLTIVENIKSLLPNEPLIYLADNKFAPYGDKSPELIIARVNQIAGYFIAQNVKAIVIACNTATVIAIDQLRAKINIPVIGVEPAIKPAALSSIKQKVAILATQATANNQRFQLLVKKHSRHADVYIQACPGLVNAIESGQLDSEYTLNLLRSYILPLKEKGIDKLVLGCTHYPMLAKQIKVIAGDNIELIDTGLPVAKQLKNVLIKNNLLCPHTEQQDKWCSSAALTSFLQEMFPYPWQEITLP